MVRLIESTEYLRGVIPGKTIKNPVLPGFCKVGNRYNSGSYLVWAPLTLNKLDWVTPQDH